jgi:PLP dependent protein
MWALPSNSDVLSDPQSVDSSPSVNIERQQRLRALGVHATKRNDGLFCPSHQQAEPNATQSRFTDMTLCRENGRDEQDISAVPLGRSHFLRLMNRGTLHPPSASASVGAVRFPRSGKTRRPRQDQQQSTRSRDLADLVEQGAALAVREAIVAKNHARGFWQSGNRRQQRVIHALISHQPQSGQARGVALTHSTFYSEAMSEDAKAKLDFVHTAMAQAAKLAGRKAEETKLIAISKTRSGEEIRPLLEAGQLDFGENRVQEAQAKWPDLRADYPDVTLHLVGQLQSNKAEEAVQLFDVIHSVDRASLVTALVKAQDKLAKRPRCFIQVNIGDEAQKGGCAVSDLPNLLAQAAALDVVGLMAVPPEGVEAAPFFAFLAKLARDHGLPELSIGMSGDFETAILLGATYVRIGTALFGARG